MLQISEKPNTTTPPAPVVRFATAADYPYIIAAATELHAENGLEPIDHDVAEPVIMQAINRHQSFIGMVGPVGEIQGIMCIRFAQWWYTKNVFLDELFLYVPPAYRNKRPGVAAALLAWAKEMSEALDLPLMIGVLSSHRTAGKLRLYEKHLGEPVGGFFFLRNPDGQQGEHEAK